MNQSPNFNPTQNSFPPALPTHLPESSSLCLIPTTPSKATTSASTCSRSPYSAAPSFPHTLPRPTSSSSRQRPPQRPRVRTEAAISAFVEGFVANVSRSYGFWNASTMADHFYVHCHSVCRDVPSRHFEVWLRKEELVLIPPCERHRLIFFSGRIQNSFVLRELIDTWENDEDMEIFSSDPPFPYEEGFRRSKYGLHVKGYEVNTERISDPLHYGCVPVVLSNYYNLPFTNVLDWRKSSIIVNHIDIKSLKEVLLSVPGDVYENMLHNLCQVWRHFVWHETPRDYDAFYMTAYQLWLRRGVHRLFR